MFFSSGEDAAALGTAISNATAGSEAPAETRFSRSWQVVDVMVGGDLA
jgi:hypothetical protein